MNLEFQHPEYQSHFEKLLCLDGEPLERYADFFDFRPESEKRKEFNQIRDSRRSELIEQFGEICMLQYAPDCNIESGLCLDHLIPLSSNKLNKEICQTPTFHDADGNLRKTPTESFGSNGPRNLILACTNCNSYKQNKFLAPEIISRVLRYFH